MKNNITKHFFTVGLGSIINVVLGFITTPFITRIADPSVYGRMNIFDTYSGIVLSFIYFGLDQSLIRFFYNDDSIKGKTGLLKYCLGIPTIASFIIFVGALILVKIGIISLNYFFIFFLFANVLSSLWQKISTTLLRLTYKSKEYSLSVIVQKIFYCIVIVAGYFLYKDDYFIVLILATIVSYLAATGVAIICTKGYWNFKDASIPANYKEISLYGLPLIFFALIITLLDSLDKLFIERYCSEYEVGVYSSAFSLISIFSLLQTTFNAIWLPAQTEQFTKNPEDKTFIQKGNRYITIIMFFLAINMIMFKDVFCYILGPSYRATSVYMPFLIIECIMYTISDSTCSGIDMSKKSYINIIVAAIPCLISYLMQANMIPVIGAKGAPIARATASIVYFCLRTYFSNRYHYVDYGLKKFSVLLLSSLLFAYFSTFRSFDVYSIMLYMFTLLIFMLLYHKDVLEMISYFWNSLFSKEEE